MKNFEKLSDLKLYVELAILGTFGNGFTYHDIKIDLKQINKKQLSFFPDGVFILVRLTGTQGLFYSYSHAKTESAKWSNSKFVLNIKLNKDNYCVQGMQLYL